MSRNSKQKETPVFLTKIYNIVENNSAGLVFWADNGRSFIIKESKRFAKEVLPHHFKTANFNSFVRQLNFYGFRKINFEDSHKFSKSQGDQRSGGKHWEFHHINFIRGRPELMKNIRRKTYADSSMASKEELQTLREEVVKKTAVMESNTLRMNKLEELCLKLQSELISMKSAVKHKANDGMGDVYRQNPFDSVRSTINSKTHSLSGLDLQSNKLKSEPDTDILCWNFDEPSISVDKKQMDDPLYGDDSSLFFNDFDAEYFNKISLVKGISDIDTSFLTTVDEPPMKQEQITFKSPKSLPDLSTLSISDMKLDRIGMDAPSASKTRVSTKKIEKALVTLPEGMSKEQFLSHLVQTIQAMFPQARKVYEKYAPKPTPTPKKEATQAALTPDTKQAAAMMMACLLPHIQMALLTTVAASVVPATAFAGLNVEI